MIRLTARLLALVMVLLVSSSSAYAQKGGYAVADGAEMERYPIFSTNKPLSVQQIADLELHPVKLQEPLVVQNHFRGLHDKQGRFVVETLPVGTLVLVDKNGNVRYKADCGNRLVEFNNTALNRGGVSSIKLEDLPKPLQSTPPPPPAPTPHKGIWQTLTEALRGAAIGLWKFIGNILAPFGWLVLFLLGAVLLGLLMLAIGWLIRDWFRPRPDDNQAWRGGAVPPAPVPIVAAQPAPPAPVAPVAAVVPPPAQPAPAVAEQPAEQARARRIIFDRGNGREPNLIRWVGFELHSFETAPDGTHSLRFRDQ